MMIVRVEVPNNDWEIRLPDLPPEATCGGQDVEEWVWKHGKDQILSKLKLSTLDSAMSGIRTGSIIQQQPEQQQLEVQELEQEEEQVQVQEEQVNNNSRRSSATTSSGTNLPPTSNEGKTNSSRDILQIQQKLELVEKLQTVQEDFLERLDDHCCVGEDEEEGEEQEEEEEEELPLTDNKRASTASSKKQSNNNNPNNPANIALRELLDSVLEWSHADYGFVAGVEHHPKQPPPPPLKNETMNDVSELDHSDMDYFNNNTDDDSKRWKIGPKLAAVNVPYYNYKDDNENDYFSDPDLGDLDDDSDNSGDDDDEVESSSSAGQSSSFLPEQLMTPRREPQPITTYGPVHYKNIPGSVTLMMDQLRFEPANPLDLLHEGSDEDNSEYDGVGHVTAASHEYNYMEVYWDKVIKYQLTPKSSTRNHLFKLIAKRKHNTPTTTTTSYDGSDATIEVILKMKSRMELERIAEDVKMRVVLPSRRKKQNNKNIKKKQSDTTIPTTGGAKKKRRKPRRFNKNINRNNNNNNSKTLQQSTSQSSPSSAVSLTQRERSVMMPPSLPKRMTSDRNLLKSSSGHRDDDYLDNQSGNSSEDSPAPRRPMRRPTVDNDLSFVRDDSDDYLDEDDASTDSGFDESDDYSDDDDDGDGDLWAIQDLLAKCRRLKRPLTYQSRKRDRRPISMMVMDETLHNTNTTTDKEKDKKDDEGEPLPPPLALLPEKWQRLVVLPIFESKQQERIQCILVLALTDTSSQSAQQHQQSSSCFVDFASKKSLTWWVPIVTTMVQDLWQHKVRLEEISKTIKAVVALRGQLKESLERHSDMIHGILPPMAISKLKVQPQQWKSPLKPFYQQGLPAKPSDVIPIHMSAAASVDDSSISGSIHSRYSLLVGGVPSLDSSSTIQSVFMGGASAESDNFGLPRIPSKNMKPSVPQRSASTQTAQKPSASSSFSQPRGGRAVPQQSSSAGSAGIVSGGMAIRGLQRQGSVTNRMGTRPIFTRMDSKRGMMMQMRAQGSARGAGLMRMDSAKRGGLMRMDSAKRGNLVKMGSARFGRGIPRLDSLRSLHGGASVATSGASIGASIDTFDQSWRTMYTDDESIHPEDLNTSTHGLSVLSKEVSYLTSETSVRYINGSLVGGVKDIQALYAGRNKNVSIVVISIVGFFELAAKRKVGSIMDMQAKLLFTVDRLCEKHRTIKVEAFGNTIVVMSGLFNTESDEENPDKRSREERAWQDKRAAIAALEMAKEVVSEAQTIEIPKEGDDESGPTPRKSITETMKVRVGVHAGDVTYGVLGQNVPQLNCFGNDMVIALRMEQTAPENCIRVSRNFRDLVGDAEREWEQETEMVDIVDGGAQAATVAVLSSTSVARAEKPVGSSPDLAIETFTLEPPPPAISGSASMSVASGFPSLTAYESSELLTLSDHGGMLSAQLEESFVSGEFDVD